MTTTTTATTTRAQYILNNYRLEQTAEGWRAVSLYQGRVYSTIERSTREETCRKARCEWGHFNFEDEARAFATIFGH